MMRIAINGFGRIGRSVFRILNDMEGMDVAAINDITDNDALAYLLKHDTVMGRFPGTIDVDGDMMRTGHQEVKMTAIPSPADLPWDELGVDYVIEATGIFRTREQIAQHLSAGCRKVILTVPAKDEIDCTVVLGVNEEDLKAEHKIVSNASCTTNCLAPVAKILDENFGIECGVMTTIHAYTNDQRLADVPHSDWRRSRAAAENIIPTTTGAAKAVGKVLPQLAGKLDGMAMRVPIPDGSIVDLVTVLKEEATPEQINAAMRAASKSGSLKNILKYSEAPIVSGDIVGDPHSSIFDAPFTTVVDGHFAKTMSWYDNEWGYSNRVVDLLKLLDAFPA
jgi:glyceraldehyde 3-phosphate dehydrogenase